MTAQRITRGFAWNHLYKLAEYGGMNLYAILVLRSLGPEIGGNYAVYLSISGLLAIIGAFAVDGVLLRYLPRILRGERSYGDAKIEGVRPFLIELLAFRLFVNLVLGALLIVMLAILPDYIPGLAHSLEGIWQWWPYFAIFLFSQAVVAFSTSTLIGMLQTKWVFFASLIARFSLLAVGFVLLITGKLSIDGAVALHAFAAVLNAALLLHWVYRHVEQESSAGLRMEFANFRRRLYRFIRKPSQVRIFLLMPFMLYGITTWGSDVLSTVLGRQPDVLMMRALLGENARDIGLYEAAARIGLMTEYVVLFGLGGMLVSVFSEFAHVDELASEEETEGKVRSNKKPKVHYTRLIKARKDVAGYQTISTAPAFIFMIVFTPLVLSVFFGAKFEDAAPMLLATLILQAITVIAFGGGMHVTSLVVIGKERFVFMNRLGWGIVNLVANYFLIQSYGGLGAIIGTQASNMAAIVLEGIVAARWIGQSFQFGRTLAILGVVLTSTILTYYGVQLLAPSMPAIVRLIVAGLIMAALTMGGYTLFRIPEAKTAWRKIRSLAGVQEAPTLSA